LAAVSSSNMMQPTIDETARTTDALPDAVEPAIMTDVLPGSAPAVTTDALPDTVVPDLTTHVLPGSMLAVPAVTTDGLPDTMFFLVPLNNTL